MFHLESSITNWRQQMLAGGIRTPVPLDELEVHLRDTIEQGLRSGLSPQAAFDSAVQQVGQPGVLKTEFNKTERTFMNRKLARLAGIFIVLLGTGMILPALGNHKHHNEVVGLAWGIPIALGGVATAAYGLKKCRA